MYNLIYVISCRPQWINCNVYKQEPFFLILTLMVCNFQLEEDLFSDDDGEEIGLGSEMSRIEHFLNDSQSEPRNENSETFGGNITQSNEP